MHCITAFIAQGPGAGPGWAGLGWTGLDGTGEERTSAGSLIILNNIIIIISSSSSSSSGSGSSRQTRKDAPSAHTVHWQSGSAWLLAGLATSLPSPPPPPPKQKPPLPLYACVCTCVCARAGGVTWVACLLKPVFLCRSVTNLGRHSSTHPPSWFRGDVRAASVDWPGWGRLMNRRPLADQLSPEWGAPARAGRCRAANAVRCRADARVLLVLWALVLVALTLTLPCREHLELPVLSERVHRWVGGQGGRGTGETVDEHVGHRLGTRVGKSSARGCRSVVLSVCLVVWWAAIIRDGHVDRSAWSWSWSWTTYRTEFTAVECPSRAGPGQPQGFAGWLPRWTGRRSSAKH